MNTTTVGGTMKNDEFGGFLIGVVIGFLLCVVFTIITFIDKPTVIETYERIQPEKRLTTDGKTIDTVFIYKQER